MNYAGNFGVVATGERVNFVFDEFSKVGLTVHEVEAALELRPCVSECGFEVVWFGVCVWFEWVFFFLKKCVDWVCVWTWGAWFV